MPRLAPGSASARGGTTMEQNDDDAAAGAPPSFSNLLHRLSGEFESDEITLEDLIERISPRAYPVIMFVLAFPNLVPIPAPGLSAVVGLPLAVVMLQMSLGYPSPVLPRFLARRKLSLSRLSMACTRATPYAEWIEDRIRPRLLFLLRAPFDRLIGVAATILSLIIMLPVPLGNAVPALAICVIAFGLLRGDGLTVLVGLMIAAVGVSIIVLFASVLTAIASRLLLL